MLFQFIISITELYFGRYFFITVPPQSKSSVSTRTCAITDPGSVIKLVMLSITVKFIFMSLRQHHIQSLKGKIIIKYPASHITIPAGIIGTVLIMPA